MNKIRISSNECVICRKHKNSTESNSTPGPKRYKFQRETTSAEVESCVFRLLHLDPSKISKIQNNTKQSDSGKNKNTKQIIAGAYCTECSKRNHEVFNLIADICQLHLKLGDLREVIKSEFRNSFDFPEDDTASLEKDEFSELLLKRNKTIRHEIASAIGLNPAESEHDDGLEDETEADMHGNVSDYSAIRHEIASAIGPNPAESEHEDGLQDESDADVYGSASDYSGIEGVGPDVLFIEIDCDPEFISSEVKPGTSAAIEKPEGNKDGIDELKKLYNLKDFSINIETLPNGIISGRSINVNLLESKLRQRPTRQSKRNLSIAPLILDFHDEVMIPADSPEDSYSNSEDDTYPYDNDNLDSGTNKKKRKSRAQNPAARFVCTLEDCPRRRRKPFRTQDSLDCHIKKVHEGIPKPFQCPSCASSFVDASTRRTHIKLIHLQLKRFVCEVCGKKFGRFSNLKLHQSSHTSERPLQCDECGETYKMQKTLDFHIKRVHRNERPHSCDSCGKCFPSNWKLKNHIQGVHLKDETPHMCEMCGKVFPTQKYLYMHKRRAHKMGTRAEIEQGVQASTPTPAKRRIRNRKRKNVVDNSVSAESIPKSFDTALDADTATLGESLTESVHTETEVDISSPAFLVGATMPHELSAAGYPLSRFSYTPEELAAAHISAHSLPKRVLQFGPSYDPLSNLRESDDQ